MTIKNILFAAATALMLVACGTTKNTTTTQTTVTVNPEEQSYAFVGRVNSNASTAKSMQASIDFTVGDGKSDISCGGKLRMKRDEVIRINLTAFGLMEVGVLEFTPDYVMIIDKIHGEYVKAPYNNVDFLAQNGLSFYSLQALFWNELFYPGEKAVTEKVLQRFDTKAVDDISKNVLVEQGGMSYTWKTSMQEARINTADLKYSSPKYGTTQLHWDYDNFKSVAGKMFPHKQSFNLFSTAIGKGRKAVVTIEMNKIEVGKEFDTQTKPSSRYKQVDAKDLLQKLLSM